jgi:hypothetical protein
VVAAAGQREWQDREYVASLLLDSVISPPEYAHWFRRRNGVSPSGSVDEKERYLADASRYDPIAKITHRNV